MAVVQHHLVSWPVVEVGTAPSTSTKRTEGVVALKLGSNFYHFDAAGAADLLADLKQVVEG